MKIARPTRKTRRWPEQVADPPREQQQTAEGDQVGVDDPGEVALGEAEAVLDRGQGDVDDRRVEDDHQHPRAEHVERQPARSGLSVWVSVRLSVLRRRSLLRPPSSSLTGLLATLANSSKKQLPSCNICINRHRLRLWQASAHTARPVASPMLSTSWRALGAAGRPRAAARPEALHRPARRPATRQPQHPCQSGCASSSGRGRAQAQAAAPGGSSVYELTEWGRELEPIVTKLGAWGARSPIPPDSQEINADSIVLALGSLFDAEAAGDLEASYELRIGERTLPRRRRRRRAGADTATQSTIPRRRSRSPTPPPSPRSSAASCPSTRRSSSGAAQIGGGKRAAKRFLRLFPMPEPCECAAVEERSDTLQAVG